MVDILNSNASILRSDRPSCHKLPLKRGILLINPSMPKNELFFEVEVLPPLGLCYLAAILEQNDIQTDIHDDYLLRWGNDKVVELAQNYEIIGITGLTATSLVAIELARKLKDKFLICGGAHATLFPEQMLEYFNTVVKGEGENVIVDIVKNKRIGIIEGIKTENLDTLPFPARHKLPLEKYPLKNEFLKANRIFSMNTSRGCPYKCSFCSVKTIWGRSYRSFSPIRVAAEILILVTDYKANGIYFREDNFTFDRNRVIEICKLIEELKLEWVCESRVEHLDEELIKIMYNAGCRAIWFGTESGSNRMLKILHKGVDKERAIETFKLCRKYGIKTGASFMVGLPEETREEIYDTLNFAHKLDSYWTWFNYYLGIPGSDLYDKVIKEKLYDKLDERKYAWVKVNGISSDEMIKFHRWIKFLYLIKKPIRLWRVLIKLSPRTWIIALLKMVNIYKVRL